MLPVIVLVVCFALNAQAQTELRLEATPKIAKAKQPVQLKVIEPPPGIHLTWKVEIGEGTFDHDSGDAVSFTPAKAGTIVKISCTPATESVKPGTILLEISGEEPPPSKGSAPPPLHASATPPPTPHTQGKLPDDLFPISAIVDANESVIPSGKMGDAESPGGPVPPLTPASYCLYDDIDCILFEYDLAGAKLGWAAVAWQVLPSGAKMNFGEFKGADLSSKEFKSFRVWARVQTGQKRLRVEFKSGGNVAATYAASNAASYVVSTGIVSVGQEWELFCVNLPSRRDDLKNVVSPFTMVISGAYNPAERIGLAIDAPSFSRQSCPPPKAK
jgi:hypothetical protein